MAPFLGNLCKLWATYANFGQLLLHLVTLDKLVNQNVVYFFDTITKHSHLFLPDMTDTKLDMHDK